MRVMFESKGGFNNISNWLNNIIKQNPSTTLEQIGIDGVRSLSSNTPKKTGKTAAGWTFEIKRKGSTSEIYWFNKANPELKVNLAKLIDQGYGTRNGGYVPPRPYIKRSMESVWKNVDNRLKGLIK